MAQPETVTTSGDETFPALSTELRAHKFGGPDGIRTRDLVVISDVVPSAFVTACGYVIASPLFIVAKARGTSSFTET